MLQGKIEFSGSTLGDVEAAVQEALKRILDGNVMGADRNEDGSFSFDVDGEEG